VSILALPAVNRIEAQSPPTVTLTVVDSAGSAVSGALVSDASGSALGQTDASGQLVFPCQASCRVHVEAPSFAPQDATLSADTTLHLAPAGTAEQVTVTAYRAPLGDLESPAITRQLSSETLETTAAVSLDGRMRQLPGVELFRRSSSLVANPSSQGISLRGLGSTAASRTLVTEDDVPLNDPIGGWIHWEEQPELAIHSIELVRGGASSLYGSSAIGGVINMRLDQPTAPAVELRTTYGAEGTYENSLLAEEKHDPWGGLVAGTILGTDGYIQEAPWQRGPVDTASFVHSQSGLVLADHVAGPLRLFARMNGFHESRGNGTPYQANATRLLRYATGADWQRPQGSALTLRLYGSRERYWQTFSSITNTPTQASPSCTYRCGESPTKFAQIPVNELGAAAHWSQPITPGLLFLAGADVHDVRFWDDEKAYTGNSALTDTHDHQRDSAPWIEGLWIRRQWTLTASAREDWFQNYDGRQVTNSGSGFALSATQPPQFDQRVFDPRLGITRKLGDHWALSASGFRAFRAPTPSELYRATQVGNQLTKANGSLLSERATGWETGVASQRKWGEIRASWFDTQINRPISAVTINPNSSPILLQRENLGQIESRGVSVDFELAPRSWLSLDGGYQYAHATVTRGSTDLGNWIPEVARNMATLNLHAFRPRLGVLSLQGRMSGHMFDDDANTDLLHSYFRMDAFASHDLGRHLDLFAAGENLFDRSIEVGKTPTTTLGMPRVARGGIEIRLGEK
jgi:outer membrane receptor protein involved in Fe transport